MGAKVLSMTNVMLWFYLASAFRTHTANVLKVLVSSLQAHAECEVLVSSLQVSAECAVLVFQQSCP